jgi:hypothetical protein
VFFVTQLNVCERFGAADLGLDSLQPAFLTLQNKFVFITYLCSLQSPFHPVLLHQRQ